MTFGIILTFPYASLAQLLYRFVYKSIVGRMQYFVIHILKIDVCNPIQTFFTYGAYGYMKKNITIYHIWKHITRCVVPELALVELSSQESTRGLGGLWNTPQMSEGSPPEKL